MYCMLQSLIKFCVIILLDFISGGGYFLADDEDDKTQGLGRGSFGQVVKARDHKNSVDVALKIIRNEKRFHRQAQEEIRILEHLRKQDVNNRSNVVHMLETFTFRNHICITFELLSINLYEVAIAACGQLVHILHF